MIINLDYIEQLLGSLLYLEKYLYQLGQLFGQSNFLVNIKINDIEIIFGKDNKDDTLYKFYIVYFDRCESFNLEIYLEMIKEKYFKEYDFNLLYHKDY
jgi:hypothetical protein